MQCRHAFFQRHGAVGHVADAKHGDLRAGFAQGSLFHGW
jgi:hypothetical protein